ncbi:MAG: glycosyltransferase family 4 protein [Chitinispirillaceae bacterium]
MKIGIVSPYFYPWYGGITEHVYYQYNELKKRGHDVKVISPFEGGGKIDSGDNIKVGYPVPLIVNGSVVKIPLIFRRKNRVWKIVEREKFDIIHMHQPLFCVLGLSFLECVRERRIRGQDTPLMVGTFHACGGGTERFLINRCGFYFRRFSQEFSARIAVSLASRDFVHPVLPGYYDIIPNGIDVKRFSCAPGRVGDFDDDAINILFVGRLEPRKGLTSLLKSLPLIGSYTNKKFRLVIVGNGLLTNYYKNKVPSSVADKVHFMGGVSFEDLPRYYKTAHIFCSPATYGESFGIVLVEAMASGVSVVAGNNEGYRKVIRDDVNGILVDPENPESLARSLASLIDSKELRDRLSRQGVRDCVQYSWSVIVDQIEKIYINAMNVDAEKRPYYKADVCF